MSTTTPQTTKEVTHVGVNTSWLCESEEVGNGLCLTSNDRDQHL